MTAVVLVFIACAGVSIGFGILWWKAATNCRLSCPVCGARVPAGTTFAIDPRSDEIVALGPVRDVAGELVGRTTSHRCPAATLPRNAAGAYVAP